MLPPPLLRGRRRDLAALGRRPLRLLLLLLLLLLKRRHCLEEAGALLPDVPRRLHTRTRGRLQQRPLLFEGAVQAAVRLILGRRLPPPRQPAVGLAVPAVLQRGSRGG